MTRGLRFAAVWVYSCVTVVTANYAAEDTPHDHFNKRGSGNAQGGAIHSLSTPTWTVPATGSGTSYAQACNSESAVYDDLLSYGVTATGDGFATAWVTTTSYTAKTTRLCDGRERVLGSLTPVSVGSTLSQIVPTVTYTGPAPSCSLLPSDCSWLRTSYLSAQSSYSSSLSKYPDAPPEDSPTVPRCYISGPPLDVCGQCTIHGDHVELLYFPVTTPISRDMCATTPTSPVICPYGPTYSDNTISGFATAPCRYINTEVPPTTDSGPSTVVNDTTLYSNRAYISYNTLYATNSCGRVGGAYSDGLVAVASSDVYSLSGYHFYMTHAAYSFNFADLVPPVPASAYLCQATCDDSGSPLSDGDMLNGKTGGALGFCSTIIDEAFKPWIAVPPQIRALDPQFNDCLLGLDALYDPPRLLVSEATLDVPSATTTPNAEPQQGASTAHTTPAPTAASKILHSGSQASPDSSPGATKLASGQDAENPASPTTAIEWQGLDSPGGTPTDASLNTDGSPNDTENGVSPNTAGSSVANDADTSTSRTAMMVSQTPKLLPGSQGDSSYTTASGSLLDGDSTNAQSGSAGSSSSGTSGGISLVSDKLSHAPLALFLFLSYVVW